MSANKWIVALTLLWAVLVASGFAYTQLASPIGDGFARGMNLLMGLALFQLGAIVVAIAVFVIWIIQRKTLAPAIRLLGLAVPIVSLLAVAYAILWLSFAP